MKPTYTFNDWLQDAYDLQELADMAEQGSAYSFDELTPAHYTSLYRHFEKSLWRTIVQASQQGHCTPFEWLARFFQQPAMTSTQLEQQVVQYNLLCLAALQTQVNTSLLLLRHSPTQVAYAH